MRIPSAAAALALGLSLLLLASAQSSTPTLRPTTSAPTTATTEFVLPTGKPQTTPQPPPQTPGTAGNATSNMCPGPLLDNIYGLDIPTCTKQCCLKCPAFESFYAPNRIQRIIDATYVTRQVSMGFAVFLTISYMVLPGKRSQPHISVLFLTLSLSLWYATFDIMTGTSNACINDYEQSTGHNSRLCGVQGVLIIYFAHTNALWCSLLIYKLHLLSVWRNNVIDRYYGWLTAFCWVFPLAFAIPVAVKNLSMFPGVGFSCLVSNDNLNTYLFYPLAIYIYPGLLCHAVTVAKMIHLTMMSSKINMGLSELSTSAQAKITTTMQAKRLLRGQWRPALMLGTVVTCLTVFWLFYYIDAKRLAHVDQKPWFQDWIKCIMSHPSSLYSSDDTQTICSQQIESNLPSVPWFAAAEFLLAILGIVVALVFISKPEFWNEWALLLRNVFSRGKLGNGPQGRKPPGSFSSILPTKDSHQHQHSHPEPEIRKGTRMGYNDTIPDPLYLAETKSLPERESISEQWVDMDALFDKEYDIQQGERQRVFSVGAEMPRAISPAVIDLRRTFSLESSMRAPSFQPPPHNIIPIADMPRYPVNAAEDITTGDILYKPPVQDYISEPTPPTIVNPAQAYLIANDDSDRYVGQPVVPRPVLRAASRDGKRQQDRTDTPVSPLQSPGFVPTTSLSPMPPRQTLPLHAPKVRGTIQGDSVPIRDGARGSPAIRPPSSTPRSSVEDDYDDNDNNSRRTTYQSTTRPTIPYKSPARQYPSNLPDE
ncbi:MAG: hypothetical protein J3R72DRAFT_527347 [Linnemannia gamsii]|nr:MAG: hypothetical protein J3R72DRAFT_527347 [Linnemannia gamsii]